MENFQLFASYIIVFYILVNALGFVIEKIKIPKIYAALFLGVLLSTNATVAQIIALPSTKLLAQIGMVTLLFMLGYSLSIDKLEKYHRLIFRVTFWVILSELVVGLSILHFLFGVGWVLAFIISISFATVGEVALLPILKEFKLVKTKLGQIILGVAIVDDVVEIMAFVLLIFFLGSFQLQDLVQQTLPLVAIIAGVIIARLSHESERLDRIVEFVALFILGPIFFFYAGVETNINIFFEKFFIIVLFTLIIKATKILSSFFTARKELGVKKSIILGVSLGIKFSTSIIILFILLQKGLISEELFSILIGIKILFKFIVPILLSYLLGKWHLELVRDEPIVAQR